MMTPGQRLAPGQEIRANGMTLVYQGDGNLVLYDHLGPRWSSDTHGKSAGHADMQGDGFLVIYDAADVPIWRSGDVAVPGGVLRFDSTGIRVVASVEVPTWQVRLEPRDPGETPPPPVGIVRQIKGQVRRIGRSFGDAMGPRIIHGCSDFAALPKLHQDRDKMLRQLDVVAAFQQYTRILWRLNGWMWSGEGSKWPNANLTVDPLRDGWFDETLREYLTACWNRGVRVNLSSGDMNNASMPQLEEMFRRVAQIAASVSPDVVWLSAGTNELRGTWRDAMEDHNGSMREKREYIDRLSRLMGIWQQHYPGGMRALSDPFSQDGEGMRRLSIPPATVALIHDVRWEAKDAIRRTFNTMYENYPGAPVAQDEPTGPNGSPPHGPFTRHVYQPIENRDDLLAIYTMQVITGQASTYFNDPALVSREPLESTWGFKELPAAWRAMEIPEHIGQGTLKPGHHNDAPLRVTGSGAERADSMVLPEYAIGVISGGRNWSVRAGVSANAAIFNSTGQIWSGRVAPGEVLPVSGPAPVVVRFTF